MTTNTTKVVFFTLLIATIGIGMNTDLIFADSEQKSKSELEAIFGEYYELAKKYHEKDEKIKEYEKKDRLTKDEKSEKHKTEIERALKLGKLNAKGYVTTEQLLQDIQDGTHSFDLKLAEPQNPTVTTVIHDESTGLTFACTCSNHRHVDFVTGYVYYTHWGLWKHTVSDYDYAVLMSSLIMDQSTTFVEDDYSQRIYPFTDYRLHGSATSATFELDYQVIDDGNPPVAIVYTNDITITNAAKSWKTYWHTSVPGGQSEAGGKVIVDGLLISIS